MTTFRYLTAAQWGGFWVRPPVAERTPDGELYVHHVGGSAWMGEDGPEVFRQLNAYAQNVKGYSFLDYDILVHYSRRDDIVTIAEGRGKWLSAATRDRNEEGEAIVLCGNTDLRAPHPAELEGLARGIVWGIQKGLLVPQPTILGHRDNPAHPNATRCPGGYLYAQLPTIRARVAYLLNPPEVEVNWNPSATAVAGVTTMPPVADTLAGEANTWAVIGLIKAVQELKGLPVTGKADQATWLAVNDVLKV